jgi:hypothetical protein
MALDNQNRESEKLEGNLEEKKVVKPPEPVVMNEKTPEQNGKKKKLTELPQKQMAKVFEITSINRTKNMLW